MNDRIENSTHDEIELPPRADEPAGALPTGSVTATVPPVVAGVADTHGPRSRAFPPPPAFGQPNAFPIVRPPAEAAPGSPMQVESRGSNPPVVLDEPADSFPAPLAPIGDAASDDGEPTEEMSVPLFADTNSSAAPARPATADAQLTPLAVREQPAVAEPAPIPANGPSTSTLAALVAIATVGATLLAAWLVVGSLEGAEPTATATDVPSLSPTAARRPQRGGVDQVAVADRVARAAPVDHRVDGIDAIDGTDEIDRVDQGEAARAAAGKSAKPAPRAVRSRVDGPARAPRLASASPRRNDDSSALPRRPAEPAEPIEVNIVELPPPTAAELAALTKPLVRSTGPLSSEVIIPISGSTRDAVSYKLGDGRSAAVNLPSGKVGLAFRDYSLNRNGVLWVWVRHRDDGAHVRLIAGSRVEDTRIFVGRDRIRFQLSFRE